MSNQTAKDRAADLRLRKEYQITLEERERVFDFQGRVCAMCKQAPVAGKSRFSVDHRHSDGLLRGLLCWKCNRAIGAFQRFHPDAVELFLAAYEYLLKPPFTEVFKTARFTAPGRIGTKKRAKLLKQMAREVNPIQGDHECSKRHTRRNRVRKPAGVRRNLRRSVRKAGSHTRAVSALQVARNNRGDEE